MLSLIGTFVSWCIGASDDVVDGETDIPMDTQRKLLSLCQDVIYLASKGWTLMPKQLALGMAIRHLNGSSNIIGSIVVYIQLYVHTTHTLRQLTCLYLLSSLLSLFLSSSLSSLFFTLQVFVIIN